MTIASVARKVKKVGKTTVEARLQRVTEIPNLEFLRFEDYCRCSDGGWGYNTRADGNVSYGDMGRIFITTTVFGRMCAFCFFHIFRLVEVVGALLLFEDRF